VGSAVRLVTEVLPGIHVIDGASPYPDFLTNVMLIKDKGSDWALLDTGLPGQAPVVEAYLKKEKIAPASIKKILITHLHLDHTGNLRHMIELTKAKTFSHWVEAAYIAQQPPYIGPGSPPKEAVTIDEPLKDGDSIDVAGGLRIFHTPGHTPGHAAYYHAERKILFSGDLFFPGGADELSLTPKEYTQDVPTAMISARRMAQLSVDSLLGYHCPPHAKNGGARMRTLVQKL
jgi:glyoxylase-like metal-dependent hydrolase (beta-lactamase superfamily II)